MMVSNKSPMMESPSTAMLATISPTGTSLTPSLIIASTGAVKGKIVRTTQVGLSGKAMSRDMDQRGISKGSVKKPISCCPSLELELIAPMPVESTANNK